MTTVSNYIRDIDSKVWRTVEKIAYKHNVASRFLAFPIAFGTFCRDSISIPAKCAEEIIVTAHSVYLWAKEKERERFHTRRTHIGIHFITAIKYAILTPFSRIYGAADAVVSFVNMFIFPFKTAKINASRQDLIAFILKNKISGNFEQKCANAAFNRFTKSVWKSEKLNEANEIHFLVDSTAEQQLLKRIQTKKTTYEESLKVYEKSQQEIKEHFENINLENFMQWKKLNASFERMKKHIACTDQLTKIETAWYKFQKDLINSDDLEFSKKLFTYDIGFSKDLHESKHDDNSKPVIT